MKDKGLFIFAFLMILLVSFSLADEINDLTDTANKLSEGVDEFTNAVDLETGDVDLDALNDLVGMPKTQLEQKIDKSNEWLSENVGWLKFLFRLEPKLSWLFLLNLYFILVAITMLILNSKDIWSFIVIGGESRPYVFGIAAFAVLLFTNFFVFLSKLLLNLLNILWNVILPIGFWAAVGIVALAIILALCGVPFLANFLLKTVGKLIMNKLESSGHDKFAKKLEDEFAKVQSFTKGLEGRT